MFNCQDDGGHSPQSPRGRGQTRHMGNRAEGWPPEQRVSQGPFLPLLGVQAALDMSPFRCLKGSRTWAVVGASLMSDLRANECPGTLTDENDT